MSHTRGLKRKHAFLQSEQRTSAMQRIMQELEAERQKKERLEWYLNEVIKEKEALSRFDESMPAVESFLATSSTSSSSTSTSTSTSSPSSASSFSSSTTSSTTSSHPTYLAADFTRWASDSTANSKPSEVHVPTPATVAVPTSTIGDEPPAPVPAELECCGRCGRQYVESQKTCRCRNFESVKKRQRCLSRFVRTGHMLEVVDTTTTTTTATGSFELQGFNFIDASFNMGGASNNFVVGEDRLANVSDEDFLRTILDETFGTADSCGAFATTGMSNTECLKVEAFLGEKGQRRRRVSFVGTKDGWDVSASEEGYFAPASSTTAVFGY